jgi:putative phosphoesterase
MKFLIISDSHGNYPSVFKSLELAGTVDHIIHLGDGIEDAKIIEDVLSRKVIKVSGNCDGITTEPDEIVIKINNQKIMITHGDKYLVKNGLSLLFQKAVYEDIDVILYGHTHLAAVETINNILFVNPGNLHKSCKVNSYAILTLSNDESNAEIFIV